MQLLALPIWSALGLLPCPSSAQEAQEAQEEAAVLPALTPADYGRWESFGWEPHALSGDGRWLAYPIQRVNGQDELRLRRLDSDEEEERVFPFGSEPRFSPDARLLVWATGCSDEERDRLESAGTPHRDGIELLDLETGNVRAFEAIRTAEFDASGRFLALLGTPDGEEGRGADLRILDQQGEELVLGDVCEFAWSEEGDWIAWIVQASSEGGSGVQVYHPASGRLRVLHSSMESYSALVWCEDGLHLAALGSDEEGAEVAVLAWRNLDAPEPRALSLDARSESVPAGLRVAASLEPEWFDSGGRLAFSLQEARRTIPDGADEDSGEDPLPGVQIWHPRDVRIFPEQELDREEDLERALLAVWDLERDRVLPVGTDPFGDASVLAGGKHGIEEIRAPYAWGEMFGRPYHDVWVVDLEDGSRRKVLERVRYSWSSLGGRYLLTFDGRDFTSLRVEDGQRTNLTENLRTTFADEEHDEPTDLAPPYGLGGWLEEEEEAVLLYDRYDVWRLALDGRSAMRLTAGAEDRTRHRVEDLDPDEEAFAPGETLYFSTWKEQTGERGFARSSPGARAESLFALDAFPRRLTKADEADVFVFSLESMEDSPDFFVSGPDLSPHRQVTETNPFQSEFAWTHAELVPFVNEGGEALQAALYYPVHHDPTRRYPMIVWTYERESPWMHIYDVPDEEDYYNFTTWTQRGYFVMLLDIAYRPRQPGVSAIEAVRPAIGNVVERGLVDAARVGLVGHSWGGYQAAYLPTRTKLFAASVAGAPLTDFVSFMGQIHWNSGMAEPDHWETGQARMEVPYWEDPEAHLANSPLHGIQDLETPLLLAHGDEDGVVEFFQSTVFYNYARRAGKQVVLLVYEGENHSFRQAPNRRDYHRRILEWFDHYLKGVPAADWIEDGTEVVDLDEEKRRLAGRVSPSSRVELNHFYVVLDEATYAAIRSSAFFTERFASVDTGLPEFDPPTDESPSLYVRGRNTYLELLGPDNAFGEPVGKVGIGLGVDRPEELDDLERAWAAGAAEDVSRSQRDWSAANPPVPWHEVLVPLDTLASEGFVLWASAYRPEFLPWLYPDRSAEENGVKRSDFLAPHFDEERLLQDVTGLTLALPEELRDKWVRRLVGAGYAREEVEGGVRLSASAWSLTLVEPEAGRTGLLSIDLATTRDAQGARPERFGPDSVLVFGPGATATWAFLLDD